MWTYSTIVTCKIEGNVHVVHIITGMPIHTDLALGEGDLSLLTWSLDGATAPASSFAFLLPAFAANVQVSLA